MKKVTMNIATQQHTLLPSPVLQHGLVAHAHFTTEKPFKIKTKLSLKT